MQHTTRVAHQANIPGAGGLSSPKQRSYIEVLTLAFRIRSVWNPNGNLAASVPGAPETWQHRCPVHPPVSSNYILSNCILSNLILSNFILSNSSQILSSQTLSSQFFRLSSFTLSNVILPNVILSNSPNSEAIFGFLVSLSESVLCGTHPGVRKHRWPVPRNA